MRCHGTLDPVCVGSVILDARQTCFDAVLDLVEE